MKHSAFYGKVVWLTGASSGIGKALALRLLQEGATVIGSGRNYETLAAVSGSDNYLPLAVDVTDREDMLAVSTIIAKKFTSIDIAIANAGSCEYIEMPHFDTAVMERVMHTNYIGCITTIEYALPLLKKATQPYLLCMASSNAYVGLPRSQAYGPSKSAIYNLMQAMKADMHGSIDVSVICPGFVQSPLTDKNDFPMPALISADQAADHIINGMKKRRFDIHFPKRFTLLLKLLALLPNPILFKITEKFSRRIES